MILRNSLRCPDGTEIVSMHRHDYVEHKCKKTGKDYFVDGGIDYLRRSCNGDEEDTSIIWEPGMPHDITREYFMVGNSPLCNIDTDGINRILDKVKLSKFNASVLLEELHFRGEEMK